MKKHQRLRSFSFGTTKHVGTQPGMEQRKLCNLTGRENTPNQIFKNAMEYLTATFSAVTRRNPIFVSLTPNIKVAN